MTCPFCHREAKLERHHVAGAANAPRLTIPACEDCHRELTDRQRDAGVRLSRGEPGDEHDRAWALVHGLSELAVAPADEDDPNGRTVELVRLRTGRAIAAITDHPIGPDPIAASAREVTREHRRPGQGEPTLESHAVSLSAKLRATADAWSCELRRPLGLRLDENATAALLRRLDDPDGAAKILRDLAGILGRIGEFASDPSGVLVDLDRLEHDAQRILALLGQVATVATDDEAARIVEAAS